MEFKNKLQRNINKNYIFQFLSSLNLTRGIWMLYLAYKGLSLLEIGLMETVYHISSFVMEIPTGAIADIFGRKTSRSLGKVAHIISALLMLYGGGTIAFAVAFFFSAMGNNLESGAGEALIYDSLKEIGKEKTYLKIAGKNELLFNVASIISLLIAGYIATLSFENVYKIVLVLTVITLGQSLTFTEPTVGKVEQSHNIFATFVKQLKDSFNVVRHDKNVLGTILAAELFATLYTTVFFYLQNRLLSLGSTTFEIGIILAVSALACAIMATQVHKLEKKAGIAGIMRIAAVLGIIGFWGMSIQGVERYVFVLLSVIEVMLFIAVQDYINKRIPSQQRATILSLQSMVFSAYMIVLFPVAGVIGDAYGLGTSFIVIAVVATICLGGILFIIRNRKKISDSEEQ